MRAGDLRHDIIIEKPIQIQNNETGSLSVNWVSLGNFWADVKPLSGREIVLAGGSEFSEVKVRIIIRYRKHINNTMRVVYRNKKYNIVAVLEDNKSGKEWLTLHCEEGLHEN